MSKKLKYLSGLLKKTDSELYEHLEVYEMENLYYKILSNFIRLSEIAIFLFLDLFRLRIKTTIST
jgi:SHS2 domain-containing protein